MSKGIGKTGRGRAKRGSKKRQKRWAAHARSKRGKS
jgi:hypothetical protein